MLAFVRADGGYSWDRSARRFRDPSGKFISQTRIKGMRNQIVRTEQERARSLMQRFIDGNMTTEQFVRAFRALVKQTTVMEYMLGRGGRHVMTQADHGRIGRMLRDQYRYINRLAADIEKGLSPEAALNRAGMYIDQSRAAYERGQLAAWDITIPDRPPLHVNCQCSLSISEHGKGDEREVWIFWRVNSSNPCAACLDMQAEYNPHRIAKPE